MGSTLALIKWCDRGRWRDAVVYVVLAAGIVYAHCLCAPVCCCWRPLDLDGAARVEDGRAGKGKAGHVMTNRSSRGGVVELLAFLADGVHSAHT